MAISISLLIISVLLVFFPSPHPSLSHPLVSNRCHSHESEALLRLKAALNDTGNHLTRWVNGTDCCTQWDGISCDDHTNHVVSLDAPIDFPFNTFKGVISESLCQLRFLKSLRISGIQTAGTIPPCLGNLSYIHSLVLSRNSFTGMTPPSLCLLTHLTVLDLSDNKLNGSIPSCLGNLSSLYYLKLNNNQLSGSIPASIGSLSLLSYLSLEDNQLSRNIPDSLGNLSLLKELSISNNQLSGTIPSSFAQLSSLIALYGDGNRFNETISSLVLPPSLVELSLSLNHDQVISENLFHKITRLNYMYLSNCELNISTSWIPPF